MADVKGDFDVKGDLNEKVKYLEVMRLGKPLYLFLGESGSLYSGRRFFRSEEPTLLYVIPKEDSCGVNVILELQKPDGTKFSVTIEEKILKEMGGGENEKYVSKNIRRNLSGVEDILGLAFNEASGRTLLDQLEEEVKASIAKMLTPFERTRKTLGCEQVSPS